MMETLKKPNNSIAIVYMAFNVLVWSLAIQKSKVDKTF